MMSYNYFQNKRIFMQSLGIKRYFFHIVRLFHRRQILMFHSCCPSQMRTIGAFRPQLTQLLIPSSLRSFKVRALSSSSLPSSNQSRGGLPRFFSQVLPSHKAILFFFFSIIKFLYDWKLCMGWGCVSFGWGLSIWMDYY